MKMSLKKKNGGYTLVELIVVMAIMVVLAGGSVVAFASLRNYRACLLYTSDAADER